MTTLSPQTATHLADASVLAVETQGLDRVYRRGQQKVHALDNVDLTIGAGQFVAIKGRSGSGKTTLLNCISGLDQPTAGVVRVFGDEIGAWSEGRRTTWRREQVGFIFQSLGLLPVLSAYENVELVLRLNGVGASERHKATLEALELVGLTKWNDHRPYELSGGQQQRVAIARALAGSPRLLIADEPTGNLDSKTAHSVLALFRAIVRERNATMLMATHDTLADDYVDRIINLSDGRIVGE
ncbi:MAG: ABC transporter ATP-binding protein [Caldilinea sp.]|uniref:ABC transporter ATP-binding protein n=1 Tax=Caldilinea sp. TaxID=2293560 RepID=UPI002C9C030F|nr:ABC transporter ATP-binding protein [Anaerolineales bacterium]HQY92230.1 ABC transporter ATP-binding protein [Caldilinea sp.]HRA68402.1 ABC transporter ATP-binding protein [Caldilinea sp.]